MRRRRRLLSENQVRAIADPEMGPGTWFCIEVREGGGNDGIDYDDDATLAEGYEVTFNSLPVATCIRTALAPSYCDDVHVIALLPSGKREMAIELFLASQGGGMRDR